MKRRGKCRSGNELLGHQNGSVDELIPSPIQVVPVPIPIPVPVVVYPPVVGGRDLWIGVNASSPKYQARYVENERKVEHD